MPSSLEQRHYFATKCRAENEGGYKRYLSLVVSGTPENDARDIVKDAYKWSDRRLDGVLETRAGAFSPKTISELEARALVYIQRVDDAIGSCIRHCDKQLDALEVVDDKDWVDVELTEQVGGKFDGVKTKRLPAAEAKKVLLEAKLGYASRFGEALRAFKVDTIINIDAGGSITDLSVEELKALKASQDKTRKGREVKSDFSTD